MLFFLLGFSFSSFALEKTAVLPKGIRNLSYKQISATIKEKFNSDGSRSLLLEKPVTFQNLIDKKSGLSKKLAEAFFRNHFKLTDKVGSLRANMAANVKVHVPLFSYGLTENLTLAMAVPYYDANVHFSQLVFDGDNRQKLIDLLKGEEANQVKEAIEAEDKFNHVVSDLKEKMKNNGYQKLGQWKGKGVGDIVLAAKYRFYNKEVLKFASSSGLILPTGRVANPDILNDIPFGTGNAGLFSSLICDQQLSEKILINEYVKITKYFSSEKEVRLVTDAETIAVPKNKVKFQTGNKFETGLSGQFETNFGLIGGLGYVHESKLKDFYDLNKNPEVKGKLEKETDSSTNHIIAKVGYSSVPAFKRKQLPLPAIASLEYRKQFLSANAKAKDLLTLDFSVFF